MLAKQNINTALKENGYKFIDTINVFEMFLQEASYLKLDIN